MKEQTYMTEFCCLISHTFKQPSSSPLKNVPLGPGFTQLIGASCALFACQATAPLASTATTERSAEPVYNTAPLTSKQRERQDLV